MSDDGRDPDGRFAEGNQISAKSGGGYGVEKQVYSGDISPRLMSAVLKNFGRLQNGEAGDMHDWLTAFAYSVAEAFAGTLSQVIEEHKSGKREETSVFRADRSAHSWVEAARRLLEWRELHPRSDGALTPEDVIAKYREPNADTNS